MFFFSSSQKKGANIVLDHLCSISQSTFIPIFGLLSFFRKFNSILMILTFYNRALKGRYKLDEDEV